MHEPAQLGERGPAHQRALRHARRALRGRLLHGRLRRPRGDRRLPGVLLAAARQRSVERLLPAPRAVAPRWRGGFVAPPPKPRRAARRALPEWLVEVRSAQVTFPNTGQPIRLSPRCDRRAAPCLGRDIAHCLRQFPAVAAWILEDARALTVLPRRQLLDDPCTCFTRSSERRINVRYAHLDDVCHTAAAWHDPIGTRIGDDDSTVQADAQLSPVAVSNPHPFPEPERRFEPRDRRAYILIDEHRRHGRRRCRTIDQHGRQPNEVSRLVRRRWSTPARAARDDAVVHLCGRARRRGLCRDRLGAESVEALCEFPWSAERDAVSAVDLVGGDAEAFVARRGGGSRLGGGGRRGREGIVWVPLARPRAARAHGSVCPTVRVHASSLRGPAPARCRGSRWQQRRSTTRRAGARSACSSTSRTAPRQARG